MPRWVLSLGSASLWVCLTAVAAAQTTGQIEGSVADESGSPLPGVTVEASSPALQGVRVTPSGAAGRYRLPALPPGSYRLRAMLDGFRPMEQDATVSLDATATADFRLYPAAAEDVVVTGEAPVIDTTSTTTGTNYTSKVIAGLPVARNYADIVRSNPGVDTDRGVTQGRSLTLTVYGATSAENQWIIDGINTTNVQMGAQGKAINNEFVQEVEVKTGGYQAEYGRALGGVINVITKSGGNDFHGGAFVYYDSSSLAASQVSTDSDAHLFDMRIADYQRTDYGADLGGYLLKDRLWFFAAYDRVDAPAEVSRWVASEFVPTTERFPVNGVDNLYSGKLTWNASSSTVLVGTIFGDPTTLAGASAADPRQGVGSFQVPAITNPDPGTWYADRRIGASDYGLRGSSVFGSRALLTVQVSRHQDKYSLVASDNVQIRDFRCAGGTPELPCDRPSASTFDSGGFGLVYGGLNNSASRRDQYRADLNLYAGNHELKAGADYAHARTDSITYFSGGQGVRIFNEEGTTYYQHRFFARSADDLTPTTIDPVLAKTRDFGWYIQDSWKPGGNWTVNLGLRWDQEDVFGQGDSIAFKTTSEWQPRIGVVWDPAGNGATKLYAFAGRFYYSLPTDLVVRVYETFPVTFTYNFDPVSTLQDLNAPKPAVYPGPPAPELVDRGLRGIYQDEFTIGIERLLAPSFTVGLKVTYRRLGNAIEDRCDLDYTAPINKNSQCALMNPGSRGAIARGNVPGCFDVYNGIYGLNGVECGPTVGPEASARRLYRGIELLARKSVSDRLWLQASYVYSSLRGNYDGEVSEGYYGQTDPGINADFDYTAFNHNGYGRLFLDRPHRFRLDGNYVLPFGLSVGFQGYANSGAPLNKIGYFNDNYGSYIQLVPKGSAGRMPTQWDSNLTLSYPIRVGPVTATLQAYVFNLFNHQTPVYQDTVFSGQAWDAYNVDEKTAVFDPNQSQSNPTYGQITERVSPRYFRAAIRVNF